MGYAQDSTLASKRDKRVRASRGGWHYLFVFISVAASGLVWGAILLPFHAFRKSLVPPDAFLSGGTVFGDVFFYGLPIIPALTIGMILGRFLVRLIPPARTALEPELGENTKIVSRQHKYAKWGLVALIVVLPLCFLGAMGIWATTSTRIEVRPIFSTTVHSYDWSRVSEIETGCTKGRNSVNYHFVLDLADGTPIDLMQDQEWNFETAYPKIQSALEGRSYGFSNAGFVGASCATYTRPSWQEMLTHPPTYQHSAPTP